MHVRVGTHTHTHTHTPVVLRAGRAKDHSATLLWEERVTRQVKMNSVTLYDPQGIGMEVGVSKCFPTPWDKRGG